MMSIINKVRRELKQNSDVKTLKSNRRFFKEEIRLYGVKTPVVIKIGKKYLKEIKDKKKTCVFDLCEELWRVLTGFAEEFEIFLQHFPAVVFEFQELDTHTGHPFVIEKFRLLAAENVYHFGDDFYLFLDLRQGKDKLYL